MIYAACIVSLALWTTLWFVAGPWWCAGVLGVGVVLAGYVGWWMHRYGEGDQ